MVVSHPFSSPPPPLSWGLGTQTQMTKTPRNSQFTILVPAPRHCRKYKMYVGVLITHLPFVTVISTAESLTWMIEPYTKWTHRVDHCSECACLVVLWIKVIFLRILTLAVKPTPLQEHLWLSVVKHIWLCDWLLLFPCCDLGLHIWFDVKWTGQGRVRISFPIASLSQVATSFEMAPTSPLSHVLLNNGSGAHTLGARCDMREGVQLSNITQHGP